MKIQFKLIFIYFVLNLINCQNIREHAAELRAVKGQFFVHMLHSAYFFPQTVDVKWSASTRGRPSLPQWMHLIPSRHRSIAFLIGTPVSPHSHFPLHIIATRIDSFQSSEQSFSVVTNDDRKLIFNILN
uniref:Secreted protein n=1 Tax=Meloidogyne incognita TaxID=6306 RepID=A0A914LKJ8_MELIC